MRLALAGTVTAALALGLAPAQAVADPAADSPLGIVTPLRDGGTHLVTLVTGDRVRVGPDGHLTFLKAKGREHIGHNVRTIGGDRYVVPVDAEAALKDGRLDSRLFNVSALVRDGFADTAGLPLIISGGASTMSTFAADGVVLESIDATASIVDLDGLPELWAGLTDAKARATGVTRLRLDGRAKPVLDQSVARVGAPEAWAAGYDGTGVTAAVLDTGWDPTHPDLAGRVKDAVDFSGTSPEAVDNVGHGTHVASTVAGTGAASDGRYKGVAPGADLIIGKVCGDQWCEESAMIAGMEWAAASGADVVNMSLGGPPSEDDLVVAALETLTDTTGTLFVVAAGNNGDPGSVDSPGVAPSAFTVGSVTKTDELSGFSSQGPAFDGSLKPDIVAPGTEITAAQAAGTPGGDGAAYVAYSGTSMATPHVTGAVALLKQARPDWTAAELKAAVMSGATGLDALDPFEEGAGRLDVGRAVAQDVRAAGSLSFGRHAFPHDQETAVRTVTYTNDGDTDVTLDVSIAGTGPDGSPVDAFTVSPATVTVPAHGTSAVSVSFDPGPGLAAGAHSAELVATIADFAADIRTATSVPIDVRAAGEVRTDITGVDGETAGLMEAISVVGRTGEPGSGVSFGASWWSTLRTLPGVAGVAADLYLVQNFEKDGVAYLTTHVLRGLPGTAEVIFPLAGLARIDHQVEGHGTAGASAQLGMIGHFPDLGSSVGDGPTGTVGTPIRIYYTPGAWESYTGLYDESYRSESFTRFFETRPGEKRSMRWNQAPASAVLDPFETSVSRFNGEMWLQLNPFGGPDPKTGVLSFLRDDARVTLDVNGERVLDAPFRQDLFPIPDRATGEFVLTVDAVRDVSWTTIGKRSTVELTFTDGFAPDVWNDADVNLVRLNASGVTDGYAPAKVPQVVSLSIEHQLAEQAPTEKLTFEVSYDEGETWKPVPVTRAGETGIATLRHPAGARSVSTRMTTVDAEGNSSEQTMIGAYGLK
ncbi:S8 family serine peptidase [Phytomonospora sp. NPDC050363]|uniref:S8 family serine peptidase n=1 Tax=Phytomonospora sp. NPDC050363 TaxID=3155642 RepID=UPI0033CABE47